ncbi:hypothetical protein [Nakamurella leprariae]|uniref:Glycosyltransferase n=1 Tax=Nakamurella leprariae TaxID=2803911 RepID=A0A938YFJ9_9ACTN|nr:hypothetical protein [Nakamurella leprariae]MBM9468621.1 hypothetical protein [Nakamurella leprariae]
MTTVSIGHGLHTDAVDGLPVAAEPAGDAGPRPTLRPDPAGRRSGMPSVTVAIVTDGRSDGLGNTIADVMAQAADITRWGFTRDCRVLVLDRSTEGGAATALTAARDAGLTDSEPWCSPVEIVHAPGASVAAAHDDVLDRTDGRDVLVFVGDGHRPAHQWLARLLATYRAARADVVAGPVASDDTRPASGVRAIRRSASTGTRVRSAPAGNLLLDREFVRSASLRFRQRADGDRNVLRFTRSAVRAGAVAVWCAEAVVTPSAAPTAEDAPSVLGRASRTVRVVAGRRAPAGGRRTDAECAVDRPLSA